MSERYLQSLAILLAGLFSAERFRSNGIAPASAAPSAGPAPTGDATRRTPPTEH